MGKSHLFTCLHCGGRFAMNYRLKAQHYCGSPCCQRARKNAWEKEKRRSDSSYDERRKASRKQWYADYPGDRYQTEYRQCHADYVLSNRKKQGLRTARRVDNALDAKIVKTDALSSGMGIISGFYHLLPYVGTGSRGVGGKIVKTDAFIVEIRSTNGFGEILREGSP